MKQDGIVSNQQGVVLVEMALFMAIFCVILVGLISFGSIAGASVQLSDALRVGEQFALKQPGNTKGITDAVEGATSLPSSSITSTATTFCECNGSSATCGSSCSGTMATYVTITAGYSVPLVLAFPGLANPLPLNKSVTVRVQ